MRISLKTLGLATLLSFAACVHAAETEGAEEAVSRGDDTYFGGVGFFNDMMHINGEVVTDWGNFVLRVGEFTDTEHGLAANVGWRLPLAEGADGRTSGYYIGLFAGHVKGDALSTSKGTKIVNRLGGGGDLGYHWVTENTRNVFSVGIGSAEPVREDGKKLNAEPYVFFNLSTAIGF